MNQKFHSFMEKFIQKFLVWAFSFCWLMIVFKACNIGFMRDLSWYYVTLPLFMFIMTALIYIVLTYAYKAFILNKGVKLTNKQIRIIDRQIKISKEDTRIKRVLRFMVIFVVSVLTAYYILS